MHSEVPDNKLALSGQTDDNKKCLKGDSAQKRHCTVISIWYSRFLTINIIVNNLL